MVWGICRILLVFHYCWCDMGAEKMQSIPSCWRTLSINWLLSSVPLSDSIKQGHMWIGRELLIKTQTMVSAFLLGIVKGSDPPVKWSMIVSMCWFLSVDMLWSVTRSMANLSKGLSGISVIYSGYICVLNFSLLHSAWLVMYLWMSLFMPF